MATERAPFPAMKGDHSETTTKADNNGNHRSAGPLADLGRFCHNGTAPLFVQRMSHLLRASGREGTPFMPGFGALSPSGMATGKNRGHTARVHGRDVSYCPWVRDSSAKSCCGPADVHVTGACLLGEFTGLICEAKRRQRSLKPLPDSDWQ